jgi:hypothetical protein
MKKAGASTPAFLFQASFLRSFHFAPRKGRNVFWTVLPETAISGSTPAGTPPASGEDILHVA